MKALPTQWNFGETSAKEFGNTSIAGNWRIVIPFHMADSKEQALREVAEGLKKWQNEYIVGILGTPAAPPFPDGYEAAKRMTEYGGAIIGTPEDALEKIARLQELSGGFGTILCFAHDWASRAANDAQLRNDRALRDAAMPGPDQADRSVGGARHREQGRADGKSQRRNPQSNPRLQRGTSEVKREEELIKCETCDGFHASFGRGDPAPSEKKS